MKKIALSIGTVLLSFSALFAQVDINDARSYAVGETVTVRGVAADGGELGPIRYLQDETGGIPAYSFDYMDDVDRGDSIQVTGELKSFNGLLEIDPVTEYENFGPGTMIDAWEINMADLGEEYEGRLVRIDDVTFNDAGGTFENNQNYNFGNAAYTSEVRINPGTGLGGTSIPTGSLTIIGLVSEFNGLYQILVRDSDDMFEYVAPDKKIEVHVDGVPVASGATVQMGTVSEIDLNIKNLGVNELTISTISTSGDAASDFSPSYTNATIGGESNKEGTIDFSTSENGSRKAVLTIESDDPETPVFEVNLYGIGNDGLATVPTEGPSNLTFENVEPYKMNVKFDKAADAEGYLVLWQRGSAPTEAPEDGVAYKRGDMIGDAMVKYVGKNSSFKPRGVRANIDYHYTVYAMNGYDEYVNYNQDDVIDGMTTTPGSNIGDYYEGIDSESETFVNDLTALINPHEVSSYYMYKLKMMDEFEVKDTLDGKSYVTDCYSYEDYIFEGPFDWVATGYSREHTFPHSWFPTHPANGNPQKTEYVDYHNLYPINQVESNEPRSNLPFGIVEEVQYEFMGGKRGKDANGTLVYEPKDENKGNAARCVMYMSIAYNGEHGTGHNWGLKGDMGSSPANNQDIDLLREWHFEDAPDNYEIARHELIYSIQGNRNPFIDSANYACYIDFENMDYLEDGCGGEVGLDEEFLANNLSVFPNPSDNIVYVQLNGVEIHTIEVVDMAGRLVKTATPQQGEQFVRIDVSEVEAGTYVLQMNTEYGPTTSKVVVQ